MGKMSDFAVLMVSMVEALFAFFVVAPCILNAVSLFGVQKRFANVMVEEGIVTRDIVKLLHPKKQIAGVVVAIVVMAALLYTTIKMLPFGPICALFGLVAGFMKYRKVLQFNSLTVQRFKSTFKDSYDARKLNAYVDKMF